MSDNKPSINFLYLTAALIAFLFVGALGSLIDEGTLRTLMDVLTVIVFIAAVHSLKLGIAWNRMLQILTIVVTSTIVVKQVFLWEESYVFQLLLMLALFCSITIRTIRQVLLSSHISVNSIVGSLTLYVLIGLIWATLYLLMIEIDPQSFKGMGPLSWHENFSKAAYFSFVTLTTLGYGDISPINPVAQALVYFEAIVGVFYIAVFVAGLINAAQHQQSRMPNKE